MNGFIIILKHHDIYPFLIIIEYSHADPNNYSQPKHNNIIIVVHNYIVVTLYILVIIMIQVCLISQSWDNNTMVSMHDHLLTVHAHKT